MYIVDIDKLATVREMIDEDISQLAIDHDISRPKAYTLYAFNELAVRLVLTRGASGWWSGITVSAAKFTPDTNSDFELLGTTPEDRQRIAENLLRKAVFSPSPETVAIALIAREIAPATDLFVDDQEFRQRYVPTEWLRVAAAVPFCHFADAPDNQQPGESNENFLSRTLMCTIVLRMQSIVMEPVERALRRRTSDGHAN